tara:strand:- start:104 stop:373 length:270 start_codon:yes stop_codon:yes gene_type:complete
MKNNPKQIQKSQKLNVATNTLFLINDNYNSFDYVIDCLVAICDHNELQAEQCALLTHYKGSCEIANGVESDLMPLKEDLSLYGLDVEII